MQEHIDSCHKYFESCAAYTEHSTAHFNRIMNISINSGNITSHKKQNEREENSQ